MQTSNTTLWTLYSLARNPDVQKQLYEEVSTVLQPDELATPASLQKMPFLRGCVKETLRYGTCHIITGINNLFRPGKHNHVRFCPVVSSLLLRTFRFPLWGVLYVEQELTTPKNEDTCASHSTSCPGYAKEICGVTFMKIITQNIFTG